MGDLCVTELTKIWQISVNGGFRYAKHFKFGANSPQDEPQRRWKIRYKPDNIVIWRGFFQFELRTISHPQDLRRFGAQNAKDWLLASNHPTFSQT